MVIQNNWLRATVVASAIALFASFSASAGPIFLTGHDPDFHAQDSAGAQNLLRTGLNFATGGSATLNDGNKFLWVESRIGVPVGHRVGEAGLTAIGLSLGIHYDRANAAEFAALDLSSYTAIAIASSFGGLLTRAELDALIARSPDIAAFINAGGGLFAAAECDNCGTDLLGADPDLFGYLPVDVTSVGAAGPFSATVFGAGLGLSDSDLNDPTHNSFGLVGGLNVVDTDQNGNPTTLAGIVQIEEGGGGFVQASEPGTLAIFGLGLVGLGFMRRRRSA